jgi:hypothetical protein
VLFVIVKVTVTTVGVVVERLEKSVEADAMVVAHVEIKKIRVFFVL